MRFLVITLIAFLVLGVRAAAQEMETTRWYSRAAFGYEAMHMAFYMNEDSRNFNGLSLSYTRGLFFSKNMTAGLETGAKLAWCHKADRSPRMTEKMDFLSLSLPVDFMYRFRLFNRNLGVAPFTGPNFRFNIIGRRRVSTDANHMYYKSINLLSDYAEYPANIFQFGWRAGLNFYHKRFFWGYAFTYDLNYYVSETKRDYGVVQGGEAMTSSHTVALGFSF